MNKLSILVHSCENTTGFDDELVKYFLKNKRVKKIVHIKFPFIRSSNGSIKVINYNKKKTKSQSIIKFYKPEALSYIKDFIYSIIYGFKYVKGSDLVISSPNLLALSGIIFRKFKLVKKTIYYIIDYTPQRFSNNILNNFYYLIDKYCCYHSDEVWSLNKEMINCRVKDRKWIKQKIYSKIVPYGNDSHRIMDPDHDHHDMHKIVFLGGIYRSKGSELLIDIVKELRKVDDKFKIIIIGGGEFKRLQNLVNNCGMAESFEILGPIQNMDKVNRILLSCGVGIAPYCPSDKNSFSYYADPGKVKSYLGCGLPVVITNVPPIAKRIQDDGAGIISEYSAIDISKKIIEITSINYDLYIKRSIAIGKEFSWDNIYDQAFNENEKNQK